MSDFYTTLENWPNSHWSRFCFLASKNNLPVKHDLDHRVLQLQITLPCVGRMKEWRREEWNRENTSKNINNYHNNDSTRYDLLLECGVEGERLSVLINKSKELEHERVEKNLNHKDRKSKLESKQSSPMQQGVSQFSLVGWYLLYTYQ